MDRPIPAGVKKKSAWAGVKLERKSADEPPNPSIVWRTSVQLIVAVWSESRSGSKSQIPLANNNVNPRKTPARPSHGSVQVTLFRSAAYALLASWISRLLVPITPHPPQIRLILPSLTQIWSWLSALLNRISIPPPFVPSEFPELR